MTKAKSKAQLPQQVVELVYQALETELGGVLVYRTALKCVQNDALRKEWEKYLRQTQHHVEVLEQLLRKLDLDPDADTPGRQCVRTVGTALVRSMQLALGSSTPQAAELVAAEAVVLAETKDHGNWSLLSKLVELQAVHHEAFIEAVEHVEDEEDEHLYHSQGWMRELWKQSLDLPAHLPPVEETEDVHTEVEAAHARAARG
jgi:rubrerythrin